MDEISLEEEFQFSSPGNLFGLPGRRPVKLTIFESRGRIRETYS